MKKNTQRSDGRYQAKVSVGNGKYKYIYAKSNKELERKVTELKIKLGKGVDVKAERDTFERWAELWLENKKTLVSYKRYTSYKGAVVKFEELYSCPISKIRTIDLQSIINEQHAEGRAKQTLNLYKMTCSQIFSLAISNRVMDWNPATGIIIPKGSPQEFRRALTDEERRWINDTPHRAQTAAMIMMYAGLRRGELLALLWSDIDLDAKTINVCKAVAVVDNKTVVKNSAKTDAGTRIVNIPDKLVDYLRQQPKNNNMLVCPSARGKIMSETAWKRLWESYLTDLNIKYGDFSGQIVYSKDGTPHSVEFTSKHHPRELPFVIPPITAHWLRHTFITMMYLAGVDVLTAKEQAGHADIKTTMQIYTHLDQKYQKKQIDKLNDFLAAK